MLAFSMAGFRLALCAAAAAGGAALQSARHCRRCGEHLAFNTSISFITNTNWQSYVPRNHHELSGADGGADGAQFRLRRHRHRAGGGADPRLRPALGARASAISGSISPAARSMSCCRSPSWSACSSSGRACRRIWAPIPAPSAWKASSRSSRRARWPRRKSIKMLGTNGGGFFNANSAHPFENPNALTNLVQMMLIFSHRRGADQYCSAAWSGHQRQGWAIFAVMGAAVPGRRRRRSIGPKRRAIPPSRAACRPDVQRAPGRRQHGRQGSALRHRQFRAVHHRHHRCLLRRRQHHA